jgi:quercetin dioxygenase-like cupin family protein
MKHIKLLLLILVLFPLTSISKSPTTAQDNGEICTDAVQVALDATDLLCSDVHRHEACYGNALVEAQIDHDSDSLNFNAPGDLVNVTALRSLRLSPLNIDENRWGVVEMRLQANIPNSRPENVTLIVFGDVALENASIMSSTTTIEATVGDEMLSVYAEPWILADVIDDLSARQNITAQGRSENGLWLQVHLDNGSLGWISAARVESNANFETLDIIDPEAQVQSPMQAFYFENSVDEGCSAFPTNGMLIQTPEGIGQVNLLINEVDIQLGSTAFIQAHRGGMMEVMLLEGHARVEAESMSYELIPGAMTTIPMNTDMRAVGPPSEPVPYHAEGIDHLPLQLLEREFEIVPPPSVEEVQDASRPAHSFDNNSGNGQPENPGSQGQGGGQPENPGEQGQGGGQPENPGEQGQGGDQPENPGSQGQGGGQPENPGGQGHGNN